MSLVLFILPQLVVKFIHKEPKFDSSIIYLIFAASLPLIWIFLPKEILGTRSVNFIQHAVGGGVAVGFVSIYFIHSFRHILDYLNKFPVQLIFVYALVSMFGVANEILEFTLDFFKIGIFSSDRYDTWFDMVANTMGAISIFLIYKIFIGFGRDKE